MKMTPEEFQKLCDFVQEVMDVAQQLDGQAEGMREILKKVAVR